MAVVFILLPGCLLDGPPAPPTSSTSTTTQPPPNHAPAANLTVTTASGPAPLAVTFLVNATDTDPDSLSYNLTFGDGSPPALGSWTHVLKFDHTYASPGTFVARLNVSDGKAFDLDEVVIQAGAEFTGLTLTEDLASPCTECYFFQSATQCLSWRTQTSGGDCAIFALPAAAAGHAFSVASSAEGDPGLEFFAACATGAGSVGWQDVSAATEVGVIPTGALCVAIYEFSLPAATISMVVAAD